MAAKHFDCAILGGGPGGLSAALMLARVVRPTVVFDSHAYRNAHVARVHGVLGWDGRPNAELKRAAREQIGVYGATTFVDGEEVLRIDKLLDDDHDVKSRRGATARRFRLETDKGTKVTAATIIFSTGIIDVLPDIPGIKALWDEELVHHCPYCHGWERRGGTVATIGANPFTAMGLTKAHLLNSKIIMLSNGPLASPPPEPVLGATRKVLGLGGEVEERPIASVAKAADGTSVVVRFADGSDATYGALMVAPGSTLRPTTRTLLESLGVDLTKSAPMPGQVVVAPTDEKGHTNVKGVYVAGDLAGLMRAVVPAIHNAGAAAIFVHGDLIEEEAQSGLEALGI